MLLLLQMKEFILAPSILSADFSRLGDAVSYIEKMEAGWVHIDVMDGTFVPNITIGQAVVKSLRKYASIPFDVHLMIEHPENHIETFAESGADLITFHYEAAIHHHRIIEQIHSLGKKAGISIVPSTPVNALESILPFIDLVLVMSVNPGFGGQKFIPLCAKKIQQLVQIREQLGYNYKVSVDGGINNDTLKTVVDAGVDVVVSGSSFFSGSLVWR